MSYKIAPTVPKIVRNSLRQAYAIQKGEEYRFERFDDELIEFETNMRNELNRGTFFDNIGKLI